MARKSGFVRRHGVMRRETVWFGSPSPPIFTSLGGATSTLITSLNAAALALRPFTVVRSVGFVHFRSDQQAAVESFAGAYGRCVVTDQAVAVGVTAVPTPFTDNDSDAWYLHQAVVSTNVVDAGGSLLAFPVESRAMRKVEDGFDLIGVVENLLVTGVVIAVFIRTLVKLH